MKAEALLALKVVDLGWMSPEEAFKVVISGGIVSPSPLAS